MKNLNFLYSASKEEIETAENLLQTIDFFNNRNKVTFFLTQFEQIILEKIIIYNYPELKVEFFGGVVNLERKKAKLVANEYYNVDFEITCLRATYNNKFNTIRHKDVLGAIHNLGINFNRFGDVIVEENTLYIFVDSSISDFVIMNLTKIGKINITLKKVNMLDVKFEKKFENFEIVSSSFRLDSIVAKITNKSRSKVKEFLIQDFIKLNHVVAKNGEKSCNVGDIISIRKYGRFIIKEKTQNKKSLKYRITIGKVI
ncbi:MULTISPECIES: YlmH family RNA-binding protein [Gemella]|uniref:YlmH family RNA-binding protein n=1 Tax=Gemella TaxID=1378 RepID=UPI0007683DB4|nr:MULTISPECIES: YlmH/Sll1252 family protein [Gemella]AME09348.1 RNA-binding protein [Gemella sp. oral taxon 928]AXI26984.1 RNA-binding protein [Gemella sp. ND 6198]